MRQWEKKNSDSILICSHLIIAHILNAECTYEWMNEWNVLCCYVFTKAETKDDNVSFSSMNIRNHIVVFELTNFYSVHFMSLIFRRCHRVTITVTTSLLAIDHFDETLHTSIYKFPTFRISSRLWQRVLFVTFAVCSCCF